MEDQSSSLYDRQHGHHSPKSNRRPWRRPPRLDALQPGHAALRLLCPRAVIGGVIGNGGAVVSQIRRDTGAKVHCESPAPGGDHGVVFVLGPAARDRATIAGGRRVSCAQEALVRVFERIWALEASNNGGEFGVVSGRLIAHSSQVRVLMERGENIETMKKETSADITILPTPQFESRSDEVIQISGNVLAVKKALIAVSSCLQDHPDLENLPTNFSRPIESSSSRESRNVLDPQAELFPNLSFLLPQKSCDNGAVSDKDAEGTRKEVVFRLLCSNVSAGSVIGRKGAIVRDLENETGATIRFSAPTGGFGDRVVTISASENPESQHSPAQNAVILVFARAVEGDIEKGFLSHFSQGATVSVKLLVSSDQIGWLSGNEGNVISKIRDVSGADVHILGGAPENQVVKITGAYQAVQNALFEVTRILRDTVLSHEILKEVRPRNSFGWVTEPPASVSHQSFGLIPDPNDEALLATQMSQLGVSQRIVDFSPRSHLSQTMETGHATNDRNGQEASTTFGGDLEVTRRIMAACANKKSIGELLSNMITVKPPVMELNVSEVFGVRYSSNQPDIYIFPYLCSEHKLAIVTNTTLEIVVSEHAFGSIYGKDGGNLNRLKEISGAKVEVHDPRLGESEGKVVISGTPNQTLAAQSLLQAFIQMARRP